MQPEIAGIENTLAVCFQQEHIAVAGGMVDGIGGDPNVTDREGLTGRKGADAFHTAKKRFVWPVAVLCRQEHDVLCQRSGIERDLWPDARHLPDMVTVIVREQHSITAPVCIRDTRDIQRCRNKIRINRQLIAHVNKDARFLRGNFCGDAADLMRTSVNADFQSHSPSQTSPNRAEMP